MSKVNVFSRDEAKLVKLEKGQVWISKGGENILEIININEKHGIVEYKVNDWVINKEAPRIQIQMGVLRAQAKLKD